MTADTIITAAEQKKAFFAAWAGPDGMNLGHDTCKRFADKTEWADCTFSEFCKQWGTICADRLER